MRFSFAENSAKLLHEPELLDTAGDPTRELPQVRISSMGSKIPLPAVVISVEWKGSGPHQLGVISPVAGNASGPGMHQAPSVRRFGASEMPVTFLPGFGL